MWPVCRPVARTRPISMVCSHMSIPARFSLHDSGTGMCVARRLVWAAYAEEAFCEDRHHLMALDPRTKLYLVALANLLLFFHVDVVVESLTVLLLLLHCSARDDGRLRYASVASMYCY